MGTKKYSYDELLKMDKDTLFEIRCKFHDARSVMDAQKSMSKKFKLSIWDVIDMIKALTIPVGLIGLGYCGYKSVKYYVDNTFIPDEVDENE